MEIKEQDEGRVPSVNDQAAEWFIRLRDLTRAYSQLRMQLKQDDLGDMENR